MNKILFWTKEILVGIMGFIGTYIIILIVAFIIVYLILALIPNINY